MKRALSVVLRWRPTVGCIFKRYDDSFPDIDPLASPEISSAKTAHIQSVPDTILSDLSTDPRNSDNFPGSVPRNQALFKPHSFLDNLNEFRPPSRQSFDRGQPSGSATSQIEESESSIDMRGTDTLQPMAIPAELEPLLPEDLSRYETKTTISSKPATYTVKGPVQTEFISSDKYLPPGWVRHTHSEGQVFFYHEEKKIVTETWLYDSKPRTEINKFIQIFDDLIEKNQFVIPEDSELVLELLDGYETGVYHCGYYFADHGTRCIFWLEDVCLDRYLQHVKGGQLAPEHIKIQLELQYWKHFEYFETIHKVSPSLLRELESMINDAWSDIMTSPASTVNHSERDLSDMLRIVQAAGKNPDPNSRGSPWVVGKFMSQFLHERFLNYYGQRGARLSKFQSIYGESLGEKKHSWAIKTFSPILFYAPDVHLHTLERIWVDKITAKEPWFKFVNKLTSEWAEHTAFATIILNANVAFLNIPGVEGAGQVQTIPQILSYISIVLVVGSIILGLCLVRQHRTRHFGTAAEAHNFLHARRLETLAILYSLPYVLLLYGMLFFFGAFLFRCLWSTTLTTQLTVGIFLVIISLLIIWCLWASWEAEGWSTVLFSWWMKAKSDIWRYKYTDGSLTEQEREADEIDLETVSKPPIITGQDIARSLNEAERNV
ncbi:hypothetical protein B0H10DRAFT_620585 [Mycena sp. CBHHK59/15]|nr:hypothetical protein B0H10DRAFT_620585 [Mycena sp. CBHHK59/15]